MSVYQSFLRPLLFALPPERAHGLTQWALRWERPWRTLSRQLRIESPALPVEMAGLPLPNPVGLAAGYDKNCEMLTGLARLGFGYLVGGTVFPTPRRGNPRPRLLRLPKEQGLINAMGFPSGGAQAAVRRLQRLQEHTVPIVVSVAALETEEFLRCHRLLEPLADGVELNISSPNTAGIRLFQEPGPFGQLLEGILAQRRKPLFVKLPPYFDEPGRERVLRLVELCLRHGVDGVTAINTVPVQDQRLAVGAGGLSGRPILEDMLSIVADIRREAGPRLAINACGGIFTGQDAFRALAAGATTVQLFTALVYRGPGVVRAINQELLALLKQEGIASVRAIYQGQDASPGEPGVHLEPGS